MPTNEQRRATAKRKLERQLERRAERARKQRLFTIIGSAVAAIVVIGAVVATVVITNRDSGSQTASAATTTPTDPASGSSMNCNYPASPSAASKKADPPKTDNGKVPTDPPQISVSMSTNQGNIGLQLDQAKAPCTVNSFISLATQGYFDNTPCHRLTNSEGLSVLQCGDPTGTGSGGPGYEFADEFPTNQYQPGDPALQQPMLYPRGTIAMANSGPNTNGSQFFLVYKDSQLPPGYTMFGTIDTTGLATLEKIAAGGIIPGSRNGVPTPDDGKSTLDVQVKSILPD